MSNVTIRPIDLDQDAERLAAMWNQSDEGWPHSWTDGQPITAEMVRAHRRDDEYLVVLVAELDDEIVGYCSFMESWRGGEGYLALLNVNPRFHGRSIGRKLIQATIERSVEQGWKRQTLGTWSANYKAVPTYKKTGHYWTPGSSVWMQCFIPGALQTPLAKPFFAKHDWYASYVRTLDQAPDSMRWEGARVYTQHWQADGDHLTIHIDQASREPLAIETDQVLIAALPSEPKPLKGSDNKLALRLVNKGDQPMDLYCQVSGGDGIEVDHAERLTVPPHDAITRDLLVKVTKEAPAKLDNGCAPSPRVLVMVGGTPVELRPGLVPQTPLSLSTLPGEVTLASGQTTEVQLVLRNARPTPLEDTLYLTAPAGVSLDATQHALSLPADSWTRLPLQVCAEAGVHTIDARIEPSEGSAGEAIDDAVVVMSRRAADVQWHRGAAATRIETDDLRLTVEPKGGAITFARRANAKTIIQLSPLLGPPYRPSVFRQATFATEVSAEANSVVVRMRCHPERYEGLVYHQDIRVAANGLVDLRCWLQNEGGSTHTCQLGLTTGGDHHDLGRVALPYAAGIVHAPWNAVARTWDDVPRNTQELAEPWLAWEREASVLAIAWGEQVTQMVADWGMRLHSAEQRIGPGETSDVTAFGLYAGTGDWRLARQHLAHWFGASPDDCPRERSVLDARIEPATVLTEGDQAQASLVIDSVIMRTQDCTVELSGEDLALEPSMVEAKALTRKTPRRHTVDVQIPRELGVRPGNVALSAAYQRSNQPFHIVRLGDEREVVTTRAERDGHEIWRIDNGLATLEIAPTHGPSLISWRQGQQELLTSTFPERKGFGWQHPWFGGLHMAVFTPEHECWEGLLHDEVHVAEPMEQIDSQGVRWRGVQLTCQPEQEDLCDTAIQSSFLTVGGSNVLKIGIRIANRRSAPRKLIFAHTLAASLGGTLEQIVLHAEDVYREPSPWGLWAGGHAWAVAHNPWTGLAMALVSTSHNVETSDQGRLGRNLGSLQGVTLGPEASVEYTLFIAACEDLDSAVHYACLKDYTG